MKIFAYATQPAAVSVAKATAATPLTSPPMTASDFDPGRLEGQDVIYFRLHGLPDQTDFWLGEGEEGAHYEAITRRQIAAADVTGAVVILANCYGAASPMVQEFYRGGAAAVISGHDNNYAAKNKIIGVDLLVKYFLRFYRLGMSPQRAFRWARFRLAPTSWRMADRDAMKFKIISKEFDDVL